MSSQDPVELFAFYKIQLLCSIQFGTQFEQVEYLTSAMIR